MDPNTGIIDAGVEGIGASVPWLQNRLRSLDVRVHGDSRLHQVLKKLEELRARGVDGGSFKFPTPGSAQRWYLDATGADFLAKALHSGEVAGLAGFDDHFRHLASADPVLTGPSWASRQARNVTWELLLAGLVATFATDVQPAEPDVVCTFEGKSVGLAAKVLYSTDHGKQLERLREGAEQLQAARVDGGFVVANLVEQFPHERMHASFARGRVTNNDDAIQIMDVWFSCFMMQHDLGSWRRRLKGMSKLLGVLFFVPTVLHLHDAENPLTAYFHFQGIFAAGREDDAQRFFVALNRAAYATLSFRQRHRSLANVAVLTRESPSEARVSSVFNT